MSKDAYYFSHDANAQNDEKILDLRADYGWRGYGIFWATIELMRNQTDYKLKNDEKLHKKIALQLNLDTDFTKDFLDSCIEYGLFKRENGYVFSQSLLKRMGKYEKRKQAARKAAKVRWENESKAKAEDKQCSSSAKAEKSNSQGNADAMQSHNDSNATAMQSKVKESKVNKIFDYWIQLENTISHKKFKDGYKKAILNALNDYSVTELKKAMSNYSEVLGRDDMFFKYKWTIIEFLTRGKKEGDEGKFIEKFLQGIDQFKKSRSENKKEVNSGW